VFTTAIDEFFSANHIVMDESQIANIKSFCKNSNVYPLVEKGMPRSKFHAVWWAYVNPTRAITVAHPGWQQYIGKMRLASAVDEQVVYFIQSVDGGPIKIGIAMSPLERLGQIQNMSPVKLRILKTSRGGQRLEKELHRQFAADRLHGEWFAPTKQLLDYISELENVNP
jgi:hypothetical protein